MLRLENNMETAVVTLAKHYDQKQFSYGIKIAFDLTFQRRNL